MMLEASTLDELVARRARETPDVVVLRALGESMTAAQLDQRTRRVATAIARGGIRPGDRVVLMAANGVDFFSAWLGIVRAGAQVVPAHASLRSHDLGRLLRHAGARLVCADAASAARVRAAAVGSAVQEIWVDLDAARSAPAGPTPAGAPDDVVAIQYTSGTSGLPKGCMMTHATWLELAGAVARYASFGPGDVALTAQPASYLDPMWNLFLGLLTGMPLVVLPRFSASTFWSSVVEAGATFFYCVGSMPAILDRQPPAEVERRHRVRFVLCSAIPPARHAALETRWGCPWREAYGTTELGAVLLSPLDAVGDVGSGSLGEVVAGKEIRVVRDDGDQAGPGDTGELQVRGRGLMRGYFQDEGATASWRPDGWARTGDLVALDAAGRLRFVARRGDVIRRGGENIASAEVEAVLAEHPDVQAAACVAVPDDLVGQELRAFVSGTVAPDTLRVFVAERLAAFKVPRWIEVLDELPMTPSERVAKHLLIAAPDATRVAARGARRLLAAAEGRSLEQTLAEESAAMLACLADPEAATRVARWAEGRAGLDPSPGPDLRVERRGVVRVATLTRPARRNALRERTLRELHALLDEDGPLVLTGAGDFFSAGEDLGELAVDFPVRAIAMLPMVQDLTRRIIASGCVVAALGGPALGLGAELAITCRAQVAAAGATLSFPEVRLGLLPTNGAFYFVPARAGEVLASTWFLTGAPVSVEVAAGVGLITRVVPREDVLAAAIALAEELS